MWRFAAMGGVNMKKMILLVTAALLLGAVSPLIAQQKSLQCGEWRWDVKTLTDQGGEAILKTLPMVTDFDRIIFTIF